jgi:hypothetical protein
MSRFIEGQEVEVLVTLSSCGNRDIKSWYKGSITQVLNDGRYKTSVILGRCSNEEDVREVEEPFIGYKIR